MGADVLIIFRKVLKEMETQVEGGDQVQFGYLPRMTLENIGTLNAESFCERTLSCVNLIVTDLHTSLSHHEVRMLEMLTMLLMNVSLMEYMRTEYDNLTSLIETSETPINKELRDETERQTKEAEEMENR